MSADNYHVIRLHPDGGYTYVMGFASDDGPYPAATTNHTPYTTLECAITAACLEYTEYGVTIHPECTGDTLPVNMLASAITAAQEIQPNLTPIFQALHNILTPQTTWAEIENHELATSILTLAADTIDYHEACLAIPDNQPTQAAQMAQTTGIPHTTHWEGRPE